MTAADFRVNIIGLSQKLHQFDFTVGDDFFKHYGTTLLDSGKFQARVELDKHETLIEAKFHILGEAHLLCDRTLEPFDFPMKVDRTIRFKYSQEEKELSDEIVLITWEQVFLDIGQYIYELISVHLPMKRLHPKFEGEPNDDDITLVYSSTVDENISEVERIDPRWEVLKKLK